MLVNRPRLVYEGCAGLAAVSLALQAAKRPPCSRPGNKAGDAASILALIGLYPGQGADAYLWTEPEDGVRALLSAYPDPALLGAMQTVTASWIGRPARELWNELRDEERAAKACPVAERAARWLLLTRWSFSERGHEHGYGGPDERDRAKAEWGGNWTPEARASAIERPNLIGRIGALARIRWPAVAVGDDCRTVDPAVVARWLFVGANSWKGQGEHWKEQRAGRNSCETLRADTLAERIGDLAAIQWPPVLIGDDCRDALPAGDLEDCVAYFDLPYSDKPDASGKIRKTTGYRHKFPRSEALPVIRRWHDAGATVLISESEPIGELDGPGWYAEEITAGRSGNARTWGGTREFVTMNRAPEHRVATQPSLFGAA